MVPWLMKAAAVAVFSKVPHGDKLAAFARRRITGSLAFPKRMAAGKCDRARLHVQHFLDHAGLARVPEGFVALELGTGWFPIAPVCVALMGADRVYTVDVTSHLEWPQLARTLSVAREIALAGDVPGIGTERVGLLDVALSTRNVDAALDTLGIERVIGDASTIALDRPVDLFFSNNTLEHIPNEALLRIAERFHALGSERAVMSHWIDMSDHYAAFDRRIGPFNFLKYPSAVFSYMNGSLHYQNRLRHSDYQAIHRAAGWRLVVDEPTRGEATDLRALDLAPEFSKYAEDDLLVYEAWMVSAKGESPR